MENSQVDKICDQGGSCGHSAEQGSRGRNLGERGHVLEGLKGRLAGFGTADEDRGLEREEGGDVLSSSFYHLKEDIRVYGGGLRQGGLAHHVTKEPLRFKEFAKFLSGEEKKL